MQPTKKPKVKICCIQSTGEAWTAIRYGASALGLVSEMPSGPGPIPDALIAEIARAIPPGVSRFLLTSKTSARAIIDQQKAAGVDTLQLVDRVDLSVYDAIRQSLPGIQIVQVIHVTGSDAVDLAAEVSSRVDALLLDSGNPSARELGGTGRLHDWLISRKIREAAEVPVFLAGGLNPRNVAEAVERVSPYGIDVCSGLRIGSRLDERLLAAFFDALEKSQPG